MRSSLLILVIAVVASHWWMLDAPFVLDDYTQLAEAIEFDANDMLLGGNRATSSIFRPVLYLTQRIDHELWGISRVGHHVSSIIYHLITCIGILVLLRALLPEEHRRVALGAALLFAVHPAKHEAVVWLAARTSLLPGMFGVLAACALVRFRRGSAPSGALVFVLLLCAFWSKESAVGFGGALAALDVMVLHRGARCARRWLWPYSVGLAAFPALLWGSRLWMFGGDATRYLGWHARADDETLGLAISFLPRMLAEFVGGSARFAPTGSATAACVAVALCALGLLATPAALRRLRGSSVLLTAFVCMSLPTAFVVLWGYLPEPGSATFVSRFSYSAGIVVCIVLALPFASLRRGGPRFTPAALYALGLAVWIVAASVAEEERFSSRERTERALLEDLEQVVSQSPDALVAIDGLPGWMVGMTWRGIGPPFHDIEVGLVAFPAAESDVRKLVRSPRPVLLGRWDGSVGRAVFGSAPSPPPSRDLPAPRPVAPPSAIVALEGAAARELGVISLELETPDELTFFDVVLSDRAGREVRVESGRHPAFARSRTLLVAFEDEARLLTLGRLAELTIESRGGPVLVKRLAVLRSLPAIELLEPSAAAVVRLDDPAAFVIRDPAEHPVYRIGMRVGQRVFDKVVARGHCDVREGGVVAVPMDAPDLRDADALPMVEALQLVGLDRLIVEWWVDGLDGNVFHRQARSGARELTLVR